MIVARCCESAAFRHRSISAADPAQRLDRRTGLPPLLPTPSSRIHDLVRAAKGLIGLDQHQVRRWRSWHRWSTLAMRAHAFLAVTTAAERDHTRPRPGLIPLTVNELRRLFNAIILATKQTLTHLPAWSTRRRKHQARAREATTDDANNNDHKLRLPY
jgi:hypothetical protein